MKDVFEGEGGRLVLWDVTHVRLVEDWKTPRLARAPSASANGSAAYDDGAEFFAAPAPGHMVGAPDDGDFDEDEEDDADGHERYIDHSIRACHPAAGDDSDSDIGMEDVARKARRRMLKVRLDIFHALQRISRLEKKGHGAFRAFMA